MLAYFLMAFSVMKNKIKDSLLFIFKIASFFFPDTSIQQLYSPCIKTPSSTSQACLKK